MKEPTYYELLNGAPEITFPDDFHNFETTSAAEIISLLYYIPAYRKPTGVIMGLICVSAVKENMAQQAIENAISQTRNGTFQFSVIEKNVA